MALLLGAGADPGLLPASTPEDVLASVRGWRGLLVALKQELSDFTAAAVVLNQQFDAADDDGKARLLHRILNGYIGPGNPGPGLAFAPPVPALPFVAPVQLDHWQQTSCLNTE